jgi:AcrR family transcriptional regulator
MLNVSSTSDADLTAQAKIRNAAVAHFARDGFGKTNLRAVAATAGVSAGLVIHHFGSKEGLRAACDEYVLRILLQRARDEARPGGMGDVLRDYLSAPDDYRLQVRYMVRAIEEDSPAAATFVNLLVDESEAIHRAGVSDGTMHPSSDPRALAVLNVLTSLSVLTMAPALARSLGHESFGPEVLHRMALPTLELYTRGLYTDDTPLKAAQDAWAAARKKD